ncbi:trichohyalin-like [Saccostrea echinata]|uniref:trichohyalin-like n=1 Tax=Saccostrea echinata TaxID=191078 RepID=UPI002A7ED974|nr:trichohyalin-like [Saccostrea echinata]
MDRCQIEDDGIMEDITRKRRTSQGRGGNRKEEEDITRKRRNTRGRHHKEEEEHTRKRRTSQGSGETHIEEETIARIQCIHYESREREQRSAATSHGRKETGQPDPSTVKGQEDYITCQQEYQELDTRRTHSEEKYIARVPDIHYASSHLLVKVRANQSLVRISPGSRNQQQPTMEERGTVEVWSQHHFQEEKSIARIWGIQYVSNRPTLSKVEDEDHPRKKRTSQGRRGHHKEEEEHTRKRKTSQGRGGHHKEEEEHTLKRRTSQGRGGTHIEEEAIARIQEHISLFRSPENGNRDPLKPAMEERKQDNQTLPLSKVWKITSPASKSTKSWTQDEHTVKKSTLSGIMLWQMITLKRANQSLVRISPGSRNQQQPTMEERGTVEVWSQHHFQEEKSIARIWGIHYVSNRPTLSKVVTRMDRCQIEDDGIMEDITRKRRTSQGRGGNHKEEEDITRKRRNTRGRHHKEEEEHTRKRRTSQGSGETHIEEETIARIQGIHYLQSCGREHISLFRSPENGNRDPLKPAMEERKQDNQTLTLSKVRKITSPASKRTKSWTEDEHTNNAWQMITLKRANQSLVRISPGSRNQQQPTMEERAQWRYGASTTFRKRRALPEYGVSLCKQQANIVQSGQYNEDEDHTRKRRTSQGRGEPHIEEEDITRKRRTTQGRGGHHKEEEEHT